MARKHKKKKTHQPAPLDPTVPRSIVIKNGQVPKQIQILCRDFRKLFLPNTAQKLKEMRNNRLKDYLMVCGQLGVSHLAVFTSSEAGNVYLKLARVPRGPTITFKVQGYSLMKDLFNMQCHPHSPGTEYEHSPLVVLNNFPKTKEWSLVAKYFQNMFPSIKVNTVFIVYKVRMSECRRVLLINYNKQEAGNGIVELRHYLITTRLVGVSGALCKLNQQQVPDLSLYNDISEFVKYLLLIRTKFTSNSDTEDNESVVSSTEKRAIKLFEQGPRLDLQLVKIEQGILKGSVVYHSFKTKTEQERKETEDRIMKREQERKRRREEQERNVAKKLKLKQGESETLLDGKEEVEQEEEELEDFSDYEQDYENIDFDQDDESASDDDPGDDDVGQESKE